MAEPNFNLKPNTQAFNLLKASRLTSKKIAYVIIGYFILILIAAVLSDDLENAVIIAIYVTVPIAWYKGWQYSGLVNKVFDEFATDNEWERLYDKTMEGLNGIFFHAGHSQKITHPIQGTYCGLPMNLFDFQYTVGYGKGSEDYTARVLSLTLPRNLPNIYIDRLKEKGGLIAFATENAPKSLNKSQKLKLEGSFGDNFDVYTPPEYEISALTILSPDVMETIQNAPSQFDIEIAEDNIYFYLSAENNTQTDFDNLFISVNQVMNEMYKSLSRTDIYKIEQHAEAHLNSVNVARLTTRWHGVSLAQAVYIFAVIFAIIFVLFLQLTNH